MSNLITGTSRRSCGLSRRSFLEVGTLGGIGLGLPSLLAAQERKAATSRDVSCILIWTLGGTSHHDTFDPKPDAPQAVRGEFNTIPTTVPGVNFSELP
jgi:uncharacterized protein (DUF1501 family)